MGAKKHHDVLEHLPRDRWSGLRTRLPSALRCRTCASLTGGKYVFTGPRYAVITQKKTVLATRNCADSCCEPRRHPGRSSSVEAVIRETSWGHLRQCVHSVQIGPLRECEDMDLGRRHLGSTRPYPSALSAEDGNRPNPHRTPSMKVGNEAIRQARSDIWRPFVPMLNLAKPNDDSS